MPLETILCFLNWIIWNSFDVVIKIWKIFLFYLHGDIFDFYRIFFNSIQLWSFGIYDSWTTDLFHHSIASICVHTLLLFLVGTSSSLTNYSWFSLYCNFHSFIFRWMWNPPLLRENRASKCRPLNLVRHTRAKWTIGSVKGRATITRWSFAPNGFIKIVWDKTSILMQKPYLQFWIGGRPIPLPSVQKPGFLLQLYPAFQPFSHTLWAQYLFY